MAPKPYRPRRSRHQPFPEGHFDTPFGTYEQGVRGGITARCGASGPFAGKWITALILDGKRDVGADRAGGNPLEFGGLKLLSELPHTHPHRCGPVLQRVGLARSRVALPSIAGLDAL